MEPIVLWGHASGPNPWKVAIILEELGVAYDHRMIQFSELKKELYESVNPNGRVPSIQDPNTGITVFEVITRRSSRVVTSKADFYARIQSGACIDYLLETYDKEHRLTPTEPQQRWAARSWRDFQMSGQGPYFGQVIYFTRYHHEDLESVRVRFRNEVKRVVGVIDRHLKKTKTAYLTGDTIVYADLMWATWNAFLPLLLPEGTNVEKEFPDFHAWVQKVTSQPSVKKIRELKAQAEKAESH